MATVGAQTKSHQVSKPTHDTVMLSQKTVGDYMIRRYLVKNSNVSDADYSVRYQINLSKLISTLDNNSKELKSLNMFMDSLMRDSLMNLSSVNIVGYASPDGPLAFNQKLATNRALDFKNYVDTKYNLSSKYKVTTEGVVDTWNDCRAAVVASNIPGKQTVLSVIDSKDAPAVKERRLKAMPSAWSYMKSKILPKMRRVDMTLNYMAAKVVEQKVKIDEPAPAPTPAPAPVQAKPQCQCPCEIIEEDITGVIIEMPDVGVDW